MSLPSGYEIREVALPDWQPLVEKAHSKIFEEAEIVLWPRDAMSKAELETSTALRANIPQPNRINLVLFKDNELAGWSWGYQDGPETFYMVNSAILPEHRRKGLYTELMLVIFERAKAMGFQKIYSRHKVSNNSILIAKMKHGFRITSFEVHDIFGIMVNLTFFTNETRRKMYEFRTGFRPDEELQRLLKL